MPSQTMRTTAIFAFFISLLFSAFSHASTSTAKSIEYSHNDMQNSLPDLRKYPSGTPRKKAFLNVVVPVIDKHNQQIMQERKWLLEHQHAKHWSIQDTKRLHQICKNYDVSCSSSPKKVNWNKLLSRVDIIPTHFVATQAATESGWGTSKLAQQNNNLFGMRCGNNCKKTQGKIKGYSFYPTINDSVEAYMRNMNTHNAYESLRVSRAKQRSLQESLNTSKLIDNLEGYSQLGSTYNNYLHKVFNSNKGLITQAQKLAKNNYD
ncbi:protein bax [Photorhabdus luminescens]|uniref:protein bax n=1 Tax=Photorhabdus luminescens TaxID=29488 RepID=UPI0022402CB4|nr:protein bax [Photorhabdus luminescens]MCW7763920.1 protein bax [Photorhabdus luminescens subsp. venezuelensis]